MLTGLSCEGLLPRTSLVELIMLAGENHFDAVDVPPALLRRSMSAMRIDDIRALLEEQNVRVGSFPTSACWIDDQKTFRDSLPGFMEDLHHYSALGCPVCHSFIMPSCEQDPAEWYQEAAERIRILANLLAQSGMKLALEYVGPMDMRRRRRNPFIWNSSQTLDWIDYIDRPNVGILLDSFHWFSAGETIQDIRKIPEELLFHVHVNDAPTDDRSLLEDGKRCYCGEGVIPLHRFFSALKSKGYQGIAAQEVLTDRIPDETNSALAQKIRRSFFLSAGI